jgi:hypothetical protein
VLNTRTSTYQSQINFFVKPLQNQESPSKKCANAYTFGYNGQEKVDEIAGAGNHTTAEFWEYDTRLGRRWNRDPVVKPWESSYACFANNPIWYSDVNGDDGKKPVLIGTTKPKIYNITSKEIREKLESRQFVSLTGLSIEYAIALVNEEKLTLQMYDVDGNRNEGGNATIGVGFKIHTGAIGSTQYDKDALGKEIQFKNGITVDKAIDLFVEGLKIRNQTVNNYLKKANLSITDEGVKSTLLDIYFNSGTGNLKSAINSYKNGGIKNLYEAISNDAISNPSENRKQFRLGLLNGNLRKYFEDKKNDGETKKKNFKDEHKTDPGKDREYLRKF